MNIIDIVDGNDLLYDKYSAILDPGRSDFDLGL